MERRFFFAILLSFVVLYGYQALFVPPPPAKSPQATLSSPTPAVSSNQPSVEPSTSKSADTSQATAIAPPVEGEGSEREIVVDTTTVQVVLTNRGGRVLHWRLKSFQDQSGSMVDLVPTEVPADLPRPFSLIAEEPAVTE